ncbi:MAG: GNAT family N-acetyltransferase [Deltaproteobacteria bacterium]|nr:GNAT family N-acetyltransferase [Deltaproteobacteria bacterium]
MSRRRAHDPLAWIETLCAGHPSELAQELRALAPSWDVHQFSVQNHPVIAVCEGRTAWLFVGLPHDDDATQDRCLSRMRTELADRGVTKLFSGGPPRWYLHSGLDPAGPQARAWQRAGAVVASAHADLTVSTAVAAPEDLAVHRPTPDEASAVIAWISREFSAAWAHECAQALTHQGLFVTRDGSLGQALGETLGVAAFAAHSGHARALGTFGPLGTHPAARGRGHATRVTHCALRSLGLLGHATCTVPWVNEESQRFYRTICDVNAVHNRTLYCLTTT